jgi:hypothetical protein
VWELIIDHLGAGFVEVDESPGATAGFGGSWATVSSPGRGQPCPEAWELILQNLKLGGVKVCPDLGEVEIPALGPAVVPDPGGAGPGLPGQLGRAGTYLRPTARESELEPCIRARQRATMSRGTELHLI